jgi:hypothetical protein
MNHKQVHLDTLLAESSDPSDQRLTLFALLGLGMIDSLASGLMSATDGVRSFFHADNCQFVRQRLKDKAADKVMSHGVQLPDLFDVLPADEAHREFRHELSAMRALCLNLLETGRSAA